VLVLRRSGSRVDGSSVGKSRGRRVVEYMVSGVGSKGFRIG
jgi:hypothetical protein